MRLGPRPLSIGIGWFVTRLLQTSTTLAVRCLTAYRLVSLWSCAVFLVVIVGLPSSCSTVTTVRSSDIMPGCVIRVPIFGLIIRPSLGLMTINGNLYSVVLRSINVRALATEGKMKMLEFVQQFVRLLCGICLISPALLCWVVPRSCWCSLGGSLP